MNFINLEKIAIPNQRKMTIKMVHLPIVKMRINIVIIITINLMIHRITALGLTTITQLRKVRLSTGKVEKLQMEIMRRHRVRKAIKSVRVMTMKKLMGCSIKDTKKKVMRQMQKAK